MGCFLPLIAIFFPRVTMIFIALLTNWFSLAFSTIIFPFLGWLFLPLTTLAYMTVQLNQSSHLEFLILVGLLGDFGVIKLSFEAETQPKE